MINLWIASIAKFADIRVDNIECNINETYNTLSNNFKVINNTHGLQLLLKNICDKYELLPEIPHTNIDLFIKWYDNNKDKKLIFYYSYISGQPLPLVNHDNILINLSILYPNKYILVPYISNELNVFLHNNNINNIIDCRNTFNCIETRLCENLCKLNKIVELCDYSIHFDIGATMYFCNKNIYNSKNKILYISTNEFFYNSLKSNFNNVNDKYTLILSNNENETIDKIKKQIS